MRQPLKRKFTCLIVFSTVPDGPTARRLAKMLVRERLAACVNVVGGIQSVFRWKGAVQSAREYLLIAKTSRHRWPALRTRLADAHPYDVPEIVALPTHDGLPEFLAWVASSTQIPHQTRHP